MLRTCFLLSALIVLAATLGCVGSPERRSPESITVEEAEELLSRAVAFASAQDLEGLCRMGSSETMCRSFWRDAREWEGVPGEPPRIAGTYIMPTRPLPGGQATGGRVLVLEGVDGQGRPYQTDFLVFDAGAEGLVPYNPVYWSGIGMQPVGPDGRGVTVPRPSR